MTNPDTTPDVDADLESIARAFAYHHHEMLTFEPIEDSFYIMIPSVKSETWKRDKMEFGTKNLLTNWLRKLVDAFAGTQEMEAFADAFKPEFMRAIIDLAKYELYAFRRIPNGYLNAFICQFLHQCTVVQEAELVKADELALRFRAYCRHFTMETIPDEELIRVLKESLDFMTIRRDGVLYFCGLRLTNYDDTREGRTFH